MRAAGISSKVLRHLMEWMREKVESMSDRGGALRNTPTMMKESASLKVSRTFLIELDEVSKALLDGD